MDDARREGLGSGAKLPSVREIARSYGVAKGTVEQALRELVREGLCHAVSRKGVFLSREPMAPVAETTTVGLVLEYERYREETNPFYRSLYEGAESGAVGAGHNVLSLNEWRHKSPLQKSREVEQFRRQMAGFLALAVYDERDCLRLRDSGVPTVAVDYETQDLGIDCAVIDNRGLMAALCRRALEEEPRRVLLVDFQRSREYDPAVTQRREAFERTLAAAGRAAAPEDSVLLGRPGAVAGGGTLEGSAVICTDETAAQHFLRELGAGGPRPGRDFVLGYVGFLRPQLPGMAGVPALIGAVDFRELGREGMRLLGERIAAGPGRALRRTVGGEVVRWPGEAS